MKYIILILFPVFVFAQQDFDRNNQLIITFNRTNGYFNNNYKQDLSIEGSDNFKSFDQEVKTLGVAIDRNQRRSDYGYKWDYNQSTAYNIIGNIMTNILNKKKLNP